MSTVMKSALYVTIGAAALWSAAFWVSFPAKIRVVSANSLPGAHQVAPTRWHAIGRDGMCSDEYTPAKLIEILNANGISNEARETRDSTGRLVSVAVVRDEAIGTSTVTFYSSREGCEAAIAEAEHIPDEYR